MDEFKINRTQCVTCGIKLPNGKAKYCSTTCRTEAAKTRNKEKQRGRYIKSRKLVKDKKYSLVILAGGACVNCGYNKNLSALHFHHKDPSTKNLHLNGAALSTYADYRLLMELDKCELLCANCHGEHHNPTLDMSNFDESNIHDFAKESKCIKPRKCVICNNGMSKKSKFTCGSQNCSYSRNLLKRPSPRKLYEGLLKFKYINPTAKHFEISSSTLGKWLSFCGIRHDSDTLTWIHNLQTDVVTKHISELKEKYSNSELIQNYEL